MIRRALSELVDAEDVLLIGRGLVLALLAAAVVVALAGTLGVAVAVFRVAAGGLP